MEKEMLSQTKPQYKRKDIEDENEERQRQLRRTTKIFQFSNTDSALTMAARFVLLLLVIFFFFSSFYFVFVSCCHNGASFPFLVLSCLSFFFHHSLPSYSIRFRVLRFHIRSFFFFSFFFFTLSFLFASSFVSVRHCERSLKFGNSSVHVTKYTLYASKS